MKFTVLNINIVHVHFINTIQDFRSILFSSQFLRQSIYSTVYENEMHTCRARCCCCAYIFMRFFFKITTTIHYVCHFVFCPLFEMRMYKGVSNEKSLSTRNILQTGCEALDEIRLCQIIFFSHFHAEKLLNLKSNSLLGLYRMFLREYFRKLWQLWLFDCNDTADL